MASPNPDDHRDEREDLQLPVSRRTLLQAGALASATVVPAGASGRVAGKPGKKGGFGPGDAVIDREDPNPDGATVLAVLDVPISDWRVYGNEMVADHNPAYESDESVVIIAFDHHLHSGWPDWRRAKSGELFEGVVERGIKFYAFPRSRLDKTRSKRGGSFSPGAGVIDTDDSNPDPAVILALLDVPISDWIVYGNETVADHNPDYDPDEPVVIVAYEDRLHSGWPNWRGAESDTLFDGVVERGIKFHAFPRSRLDRRRSNGR